MPRLPRSTRPRLRTPGTRTHLRGSPRRSITVWSRRSCLTRYKGFLWYQGETDSAPDRAGLYAKLLPTLIADWRRQWHQGDLPFLLVQISSFESPKENWD